MQSWYFLCNWFDLRHGLELPVACALHCAKPWNYSLRVESTDALASQGVSEGKIAPAPTFLGPMSHPSPSPRQRYWFRALWGIAPVLDAVTVERPRLTVARLGAGHFDL
jgi:hypothetical protein